MNCLWWFLFRHLYSLTNYINYVCICDSQFTVIYDYDRCFPDSMPYFQLKRQTCSLYAFRLIFVSSINFSLFFWSFRRFIQFLVSKIEADWGSSDNSQYHIQTDEGPERFFRYQTDNGQFRNEKRLKDGTVIGRPSKLNATPFWASRIICLLEFQERMRGLMQPVIYGKRITQPTKTVFEFSRIKRFLSVKVDPLRQRFFDPIFVFVFGIIKICMFPKISPGYYLKWAYKYKTIGVNNTCNTNSGDTNNIEPTDCKRN